MTIEVAASTVSFPSEYRRYRLYLKDNAMRTLATFENAYRLASAMSDQTAGAYVIVATRDPDQPHRIEPAAGQPDALALIPAEDRKSVVKGKSVSVRGDLGGRPIIKQKKQKQKT